MLHVLGSAQGGDASISNLTLILSCVGIVIGVALAAMVPLVIAAARRHRKPEGFIALTVLWACLAAASLIYATMVQMRWSAERDLRISTGYYDTPGAADAPPLPTVQWLTLGTGYVALVTGATVRRASGIRKP